MSIIQEALKKVQVEPQRRDLPQKMVIAPKIEKNEPVFLKEKTAPLPIIVLALIVVSGIAARQYLWYTKAQTKPVLPVKAAAKAGASGPVGQKKASRAEPTFDAAIPRIARPEMPKFDLNGIMYLESGPKAIINDVVVEEGDVISGALVAKINSQNVLLKFSDSEIMLKLK